MESFRSFWDLAAQRLEPEPPRDVARAIAELTEGDLLRLKVLARLRVRGLPGGVGWADLLHETILRALSGARRWPAGVPLMAFLAGVMRSVCSEHWRRARRERQVLVVAEAGVEAADTSPGADQERQVAAAEALAAIYRHFAEDETVLRIMAGLAEGLSAREIRRRHDMTQTEYDTARKRLRRAVLRGGLNGPGCLEG